MRTARTVDSYIRESVLQDGHSCCTDYRPFERLETRGRYALRRLFSSSIEPPSHDQT